MDRSDSSNIIDAIGGIPMTVEQEMSYGGVTVYPGEQVLDGQHALVLCVRAIFMIQGILAV